MSKVFLTNATGYIGSAVAEEFKKNGHDVTALARNEQSAEKLKTQGITPLRGDLKQPLTFLDAVRQADIIVHTAATNDSEFEVTDKTATEEILKALENSNKTFIYTSGVWVLGNTGNKAVDEEAPTNPIPHVAFRANLEKEVRAAKNRGIKTIVIRPTIVYGREGGLISGFLATAKKDGYARFVGSGDNRISSVHIDDLAKLYVLAADKAVGGELFHGANGSTIKLREIAETVAEVAGVAGNVKSWPVEEARKVVGSFVDGFILDQIVIAPITEKQLGWQAKSLELKEDLRLSSKTVSAQKQ